MPVGALHKVILAIPLQELNRIIEISSFHENYMFALKFYIRIRNKKHIKETHFLDLARIDP